MANWHALVIEDDPDGQEVVGRILRHHQIDSSVSVVVAERRPALFSVNLDPGLLPRYRT